MSRRLEGEYYRPSNSERVPGSVSTLVALYLLGVVKWLSPESLSDRKYSHASDIWYRLLHFLPVGQWLIETGHLVSAFGK